MSEVKTILGKGGLLSKKLDSYTERPSQIQLAEEIYDSYENGDILLANAPTGIGKSISGLVPAILHAKKYKTVISTATKALQMQYFNKDLPFLYDMFDGSFNYAMLKGRSNYLCLNRLNQFKQDKVLQGKLEFELVSEFEKIEEWSKTTESGDLEELGFNVSPIIRSEICSDSDECGGKSCDMTCYYNRNKKKAKESDIVLVNTDLLCTDLVARASGASVLPNYHSLILDEAHHLENTVSKYLGGRMSHNVIKSCVGLIMKYLKELSKNVSKEYTADLELATEQIDSLCVKLKKSSEEFFNNFYFDTDEECIRLISDDIDTMTKLSHNKVNKLITKIGMKLPDAENYTSDVKVIKLFDSANKRIERCLSALNDIMSLADDKLSENLVFWVSYNSKKEPVIEHCPIDISETMCEWLFTRIPPTEWDKIYESNKREDEEKKRLPIRNVVLMSATLTTNNNFDFFKNRMGIYKRSEIDGHVQLRETKLPSAFDYKHQALLYLPRGIVEPSNNKSVSETFTLQLSQNIIEIAKISKGRMLCLFTSYSEMEKIYNLINGKVPYNIYHQNMMQKSQLINVFSNDINSILLATSSFWEGASFEGETVSVVIMDKIPFPVPSEPVIEARIDKIKEDGGDWFNDYYLPMANIQLQQGFGRLIRTKYDYGLVMIADKRIITKGYGWKFIRSLPETYQTNNIKKVERFFELIEMKRDILRRKRKIKDNKVNLDVVYNSLEELEDDWLPVD